MSWRELRHIYDFDFIPLQTFKLVVCRYIPVSVDYISNFI